VQRDEWEDAMADTPELAGAYPKEVLAPLGETDSLELIDGEAEVAPGVVASRTGGHSRGHQIVYLGAGARRGVYLGDLCPSVAHLPTFWTMAYDQFPLEVRRLKVTLLGQIADRDWLTLFDHDVAVKAASLTRDPKTAFAVRENVVL
jgi:glyoxylase-like metal-dependent hydrolase (beta-lactamase superfamily II)